MINTNNFKTGQTIKLNNNIYQILSFLHVKPGKGAAFVRSELKNLKTGKIIEYTFNAGIKIEKALITKVKLKFSYFLRDIYIFFDPLTYEEYQIPLNKVEKILKYLKEEILVEIIFDENKNILDISVPDKISLKVIDTEPISSSNNTKKNTAYKNAILETGLIIKVPIFIEKEERIIINTTTDFYLSRDTKK